MQAAPHSKQTVILATVVGALTAALLVVIYGRAIGLNEAKMAMGAVAAAFSVGLTCFIILDR